MRFEYNKDVKKRDELLGITGVEGFGGVIHFSGLNAQTLGELIALKFADPQDQQNDAPELGDIYEFLCRNPEFTAHGYAVVIERSDYRISIEGVEGSAKDTEAFLDFVEMFRFADEFEATTTYQRCWYD